MSGFSGVLPGPRLVDLVRAVLDRPVMVVKPTDRVHFTVNRVEWQRAISGTSSPAAPSRLVR